MARTELQGAHGTMPVYVAEPAGDGPWPGVVIVHDAIGMSAGLRRQADWFAEAGNLAAAPEVPLWSIVLDRLTSSGSGYVEASAMDARLRIVALFDRHLLAPTGGSR